MTKINRVFNKRSSGSKSFPTPKEEMVTKSEELIETHEANSPSFTIVSTYMIKTQVPLGSKVVSLNPGEVHTEYTAMTDQIRKQLELFINLGHIKLK